LELLLHLNLAKVKEELISSIDLARGLLDQFLDLMDRCLVLIRGTSQHVREDVRKLILVIRGRSEEVVVEIH
jgi:hypothetical protein